MPQSQLSLQRASESITNKPKHLAGWPIGIANQIATPCQNLSAGRSRFSLLNLPLANQRSASKGYLDTPSAPLGPNPRRGDKAVKMDMGLIQGPDELHTPDINLYEGFDFSSADMRQIIDEEEINDVGPTTTNFYNDQNANLSNSDSTSPVNYYDNKSKTSNDYNSNNLFDLHDIDFDIQSSDLALNLEDLGLDSAECDQDIDENSASGGNKNSYDHPERSWQKPEDFLNASGSEMQCGNFDLLSALNDEVCMSDENIVAQAIEQSRTMENGIPDLSVDDILESLLLSNAGDGNNQGQLASKYSSAQCHPTQMCGEDLMLSGLDESFDLGRANILDEALMETEMDFNEDALSSENDMANVSQSIANHTMQNQPSTQQLRHSNYISPPSTTNVFPSARNVSNFARSLSPSTFQNLQQESVPISHPTNSLLSCTSGLNNSTATQILTKNNCPKKFSTQCFQNQMYQVIQPEIKYIITGSNNQIVQNCDQPQTNKPTITNHTNISQVTGTSKRIKVVYNNNHNNPIFIKPAANCNTDPIKKKQPIVISKVDLQNYKIKTTNTQRKTLSGTDSPYRYAAQSLNIPVTRTLQLPSINIPVPTTPVPSIPPIPVTVTDFEQRTIIIPDTSLVSKARNGAIPKQHSHFSAPPNPSSHTISLNRSSVNRNLTATTKLLSETSISTTRPTRPGKAPKTSATQRKRNKSIKQEQELISYDDVSSREQHMHQDWGEIGNRTDKRSRDLEEIDRRLQDSEEIDTTDRGSRDLVEIDNRLEDPEEINTRIFSPELTREEYEELSPAAKYFRMRKQNNEASKKCREKRKFQLQMNFVQLDSLEEENGKLNRQYKDLLWKVKQARALVQDLNPGTKRTLPMRAY